MGAGIRLSPPQESLNGCLAFDGIIFEICVFYTVKVTIFMKKPILTLILIISCLAGFAQEPIEVMVQMKAQYNRTELYRKIQYIPTRAERRDFVVKELQTFTEASQYDLMLNKNPELTPAQICQILEETSVRLSPTKSNLTGVGRVDALAAVNAVPEWDALDESYNTMNDLPDASVQQIFDVAGRIVTSDKLSPGVYLIQYLQGNQLRTKKIVIQ